MNHDTAMTTITADSLYGREQLRVILAQAVADFYELEKESRKGDEDINIMGEARRLKAFTAEVEGGSVTVSSEWLDFAEKMEVSYAEYRPRTLAEAIQRATEAHHRWTRYDDLRNQRVAW